MVSLFKKIRNRFLRIALVIVTIVIIVCGVIIAFISPIAKHLIEKNSVKLIHRQVEIGWLYVNPFTGHIHAHNVVMYEKDGRKKFISIGGLSFNVSLRGLLSKKFDFYSITLNHLHLSIIENKAQFNFDDIFAKDTTAPQKPGAPVKFYVRDIHLTNSIVEYSEVTIPVHYYVTKLNVECPGIEWDVDSAQFKYDFNFLDTGGTVKGLFAMNFKNNNFEMKPVFSHFDLSSIKQYIGEFAKKENFTAYLNADVDAKGNFKDAKYLLATGKLELNNFHFGRRPGNDYLSFSTLKIDIDSLSPLNKKYFLNTILLDSLYVRYERYDSLDNFSRMFGVGGANVKNAAQENYSQNIIFQIAHFFSQIAQNIVNSQYRVKQFQVTNSQLVYNDYSLAERFSLRAEPVVVTAKNIDTRANRTYLQLNFKVNPFGDITANFDVNPKDYGDFNLTYGINDFPIPLFNPYAVTYTSYPFDKGTLALNGTWHVLNKNINSVNHLVVVNPTLALPVKGDDTKKIPMRVIMFFVRDVNRRIDVELPISGNLNDPKYHLWGAILQVLENLVVKPPALPITSVKLAQTKDKEDYITMEWQLRQNAMTDKQRDQLKKIARYLSSHPDSKVTIEPHYFTNEEREMIVLFEAKKKFYALQHHIAVNQLTKDDSLTIARNSTKDTLFIRYLERTVKDSLDFTTQSKCIAIIGRGRVDALYNDLITARKNQILSFFSDKNISNRVTFENGISEIPTSGFSHYVFYYKGEKPSELAQQ